MRDPGNELDGQYRYERPQRVCYSPDLVINGVSILGILGINRVCFFALSVLHLGPVYKQVG